MILSEFMAAHARREWSWPDTNCALVLADWAMACGHADPARIWRGVCADETGFRVIVEECGGLVAVVSRVCALAGFDRAEAPARGVIGVVGSEHEPMRQFAAIHDGARWQVRAPDGFIALAARPLAMWSVPWRR